MGVTGIGGEIGSWDQATVRFGDGQRDRCGVRSAHGSEGGGAPALRTWRTSS